MNLAHPIFSTQLFRANNLLERLFLDVKCRRFQEGDKIQPTGIPPHIGLLTHMSDLASRVDMIIPGVVGGVVHEIEERAIQAGTVTRHGLESVLTQVLETSGVLSLVRNNTHVFQASSTTTSSSTVQPASRTFEWGGSAHLVPEDFVFPAGGLLQAFQAWCIGDPAKGYPPLRSLSVADMSTKNNRKRLCDFKLIMSKLEDISKSSGVWIENPSPQQVNDMFGIAEPGLGISEASPKDRKRRKSQISWSTSVNLLRTTRARTS